MRTIEQLFDIQSEAGIVATLISHPDFILYSEQLKPDYFSDSTNSCLFWAISELYHQNIKNIDAYNLMVTIDTNKWKRKEIGEDLSIEYIKSILSLSTFVARDTPEEYKRLVSIVSDLACKRKLYKDLEICKNECLKEEHNISDVHKLVQKKIDDVATDFITSDVVPFGDIVMQLWEETTSRFNLVKGEGYNSKFQCAYNYFSYEPNELALLAAKTKVGKSVYALNECVHKLQNGIGIIYIDTELTDRLFNERMLAHLCQIEFQDIKHGTFNEEQAKEIIKNLKWITSQNFYHLHMPTWDKEKLFIIAKKLKRERNTTFFIFDHLKTTNSSDASIAYHELGSKVNFLKDVICGEVGYAGLALAQLNRTGDIGESFKLEQEVSVVLNLFPKTEEEIMRDGKECGNYKIFVKANRNGNKMDDPSTEYLDIMFWGKYCSIEDAKQHESKTSPFE